MSLVNPQLERIFYGFELDFLILNSLIENKENVEENVKILLLMSRGHLGACCGFVGDAGAPGQPFCNGSLVISLGSATFQ